MALQKTFETQGICLFRYRSYIPIILLVAGLLVFIVTVRFSALPCIFLRGWKYYEWICLALSLSGLAVRVYTVAYTPAGTSGRNVRSQQADSLNTTGIYSVVRHPLYLGNSLMYTGIALLTCNAGFVVVSILLLWLYYERIMYAEEIFLRNKFGDKFLSWADITPAFIPHFRHFRRSPLRFSWKKVLKKEKNGQLALFLVFSVFDVISHTLFQTKINVAFLVLSAVCSAAYIVLKIIKRHTHLLDEKGR